MSARNAPLRWIERVLFAIGLSLLLYCGWAVWSAWRFQERAQELFARELNRRAAYPAKTRVALPIPRPRRHAVMGRIDIPRLGISTMIVQGVDGADLRRGVGHIENTPLPGDAGNVVLAAHRDTFFRPLRFIRDGDWITLTTLEGRYSYRVTSTRIVQPDDAQPLGPSKRKVLTLVTCYPFYYVGAAPERFIVRAEWAGAEPAAG